MSALVLRVPRLLLTARAWLLLVPVLVLLFDPARARSIFGIAAGSFLHTLPFIAFAVLSIAYLKATRAEAAVANAFVGRESTMIVLAALVGAIAPFCSCEVVPFVAGLLAVGVPLSAVMAFWLASPLMDLPTLLITAGALGWEFAVGKAIAAVALGLLGGFVVRALIRRGAFANPLRPQHGTRCCASTTASGSSSGSSSGPVWRFWREPGRSEVFRSALFTHGVLLIQWLALAYLFEGLLVTYISTESVAQVVGGEGLGPILLGALVGVPAYVNGYAAPALVAGLLGQGMSNGAAMAFLVGGAVTCIPAMAAIASLVRAPVFAMYLALGMVGAMCAGVAFAAVA